MQLPSGIVAVLMSALLFGISTPLAKLLVAEVSPLALAGLLYLGAGVGLLTWRWWRLQANSVAEAREAPLAGRDWVWMAWAILAGGVVAPVLLMLGLERTSGAAAALLLNFEGVFTALLAWFVFQENVDRRVAIGFLLIAGGGALLSWERAPDDGLPLGALAVMAALPWIMSDPRVWTGSAHGSDRSGPRWRSRRRATRPGR